MSADASGPVTPAGAIAPLNASGPVIGGVNPPAGAIAPLNASGPVIGGVNPPAGAIASLNAVALEAFLARLYTDEALRRRFLADPHAEIQRAKLGELSAELERIDAAGLELMAESLAAKKRDRGRR